jgi:hypothetical protein
MTTIYLPPPTSAEIKSPLLVRESLAIPQCLVSQERQKLAEFKEQIWETLTLSEKELDTLADHEEIHYNPVPPKRTLTMKVRYRSTGRMQPQPYLLEDE